MNNFRKESTLEELLKIGKVLNTEQNLDNKNNFNKFLKNNLNISKDILNIFLVKDIFKLNKNDFNTIFNKINNKNNDLIKFLNECEENNKYNNINKSTFKGIKSCATLNTKNNEQNKYKLPNFLVIYNNVTNNIYIIFTTIYLLPAYKLFYAKQYYGNYEITPQHIPLPH